MKETYLTKEGYEELKGKLNELKTVRRKEIAEAIHAAKEQGDLSENAEYVSAKEEQRRIETQIADLESAIKHAMIVERVGTSAIGVGNTVKLDCKGGIREYKIVGSNESNPMAGKISNESPMGVALMGHKKGDAVTIPTPNGKVECTVKEIK